MPDDSSGIGRPDYETLADVESATLAEDLWLALGCALETEEVEEQDLTLYYMIEFGNPADPDDQDPTNLASTLHLYVDFEIDSGGRKRLRIVANEELAQSGEAGLVPVDVTDFSLSFENTVKFQRTAAFKKPGVGFIKDPKRGPIIRVYNHNRVKIIESKLPDSDAVDDTVGVGHDQTDVAMGLDTAIRFLAIASEHEATIRLLEELNEVTEDTT